MKKTLFFIIFAFLSVQNFAQNDVIASGDVGIKSEVDKNKTKTTNVDNTSIVKPVKFIKNSLKISKHGINYNIDKPGFVSIKIFDYEGNEIASLINREQKAGSHFANFSTINFSSGIYKYCVSVDGESICSRTLFVN